MILTRGGLNVQACLRSSGSCDWERQGAQRQVEGIVAASTAAPNVMPLTNWATENLFLPIPEQRTCPRNLRSGGQFVGPFSHGRGWV
jgi:hypothetical protein